jgi:hypothetical protein
VRPVEHGKAPHQPHITRRGAAQWTSERSDDPPPHPLVRWRAHQDQNVYSGRSRRRAGRIEDAMVDSAVARDDPRSPTCPSGRSQTSTYSPFLSSWISPGEFAASNDFASVEPGTKFYEPAVCFCQPYTSESTRFGNSLRHNHVGKDGLSGPHSQRLLSGITVVLVYRSKPGHQSPKRWSCSITRIRS